MRKFIWALVFAPVLFCPALTFAQSHSAAISWTPAAQPTGITIASWNVLRGTATGGPYAQIASTPVGTTNYTDSSVSSGQHYFYVVRAVDTAGVVSANSTQVEADVPTSAPPLAVSTTSLPTATVGVSYSAVITAGGGIGPYTWSGTVGDGLTLSQTGLLSGTPSQAGTFAQIFTVKDSTGGTASASLPLSVANSLPVGVATPISLIQRATFSHQPSSNGTVTLTLPRATGAGHTLIVGVSFWPLDITGVTDGSSDTFTRGLATSISHATSQGGMYTNFYYAQSTRGGTNLLTLQFAGGSTYLLAAVAEVAGLDTSAPFDQSAYNESLSATATPWNSAVVTTRAANEYLFSWAASEWTNSSCSSPAAGWTIENQINDSSGSTICLVDQIVSASGPYQVSVVPRSPQNYVAELVTFKGSSSTPLPMSAPQVSSVSATSGAQGQGLSSVTISGSNFQIGATCSLDAGITVNSCGFNSSTQLTANISINPTAAAGTRNVTVTNPDGQSGILTAGFTVTAPAAISLIQKATFSRQPSSSGTVTLTLPQATGAGHAIIVGVTFWPLDIIGVSDGSGDVFTRGLATSIFHNTSQGAMYTNFYYTQNTNGGTNSLTLQLNGGSPYLLVAVAEVAGLNSSPLDQSAYKESLSATASPWSSGTVSTTAPNEYLFSWAASEWSNAACSNATPGWAIENQTNDSSGSTICLVDRIVSAPGPYQVSVVPGGPQNYAMEIVTFKAAQ